MRNIYDFYEKHESKQKHHKFTTSKEVLEGELHQDIKNLCVYLWENPNVMITIIKNCYNKHLVKNIIQLITNRFYNNFVSPDIIEPQLFYIISYFLKKEINELSIEHRENFLKKSICHKIFKYLKRNPKLILFFKKILKEFIEEVHFNTQSKNNEAYELLNNNKIYLSIPMIEEAITEKKNEEKKSKDKYKNIFKNFKKAKSKHDINDKAKINDDVFSNCEEISKNLFSNVTQNLLSEKIKDYNNNDKNSILMREYCESQLKNFENKSNETKGELYTNNNLLKRISDSSIREVEIVYKRNISLAIYYINKLLNILNKNINEIPYQIKQICKLIELLAKKKFPNIKKFELNAIIGKFLFVKILFPIIMNPQLNSLLIISKYFSDDLYYNLLAITRYMKIFILGFFYYEYNAECDFTPFNYFFLEKMPVLNEIIEKSCAADIPEYIYKYIFESDDNEMIDIDFNLMYNEKYYIYHQAFCVSFGDLSLITKNIFMNQELFKNEKKIQLHKLWDKISKNKYYKDLILSKAQKENPIQQDKNDKNKFSYIEKDAHDIYQFMNNLSHKNKINKEYFILNNTIFNTKSHEYQELNASNDNYLNFNVNKDKDKERSFDFLKFLKNSFYRILDILPSFSELESSIQINAKNITDFHTLLIELKKYVSNYYFHYMNFDQIGKNIELTCALDFISENESKLSNELKLDNYSLFFIELEKDINKSVKNTNDNLDFISHFHDNNTNLIKKQENFSLVLSYLRKINLNFIVQKIIKQFPAYIQVSVKINNKNKNNSKSKWGDLVFEIKRGKNKDDKSFDANNIYISEKNNYINYKTIESFIEYFSFENEHFNPHGSGENSGGISDIFSYMSELKIPEKINNFIDISLKEILTERLYNDIYSKQDIPNILKKLKKIILNGLYDNIYKNYLPYSNDNLLYKKTKMLSWTNLSNFTNEPLILQQSLIPPIVECFKKLHRKKTPRKKLWYLLKINDILLTIHCEKEINYVDKNINITQPLNPILLYSIIQTQPQNLYSDMRYIEIFMNEKEKEKIYIEEIKNHISFIIEVSYKDLCGNITEEDYNKNCKEYYNE